MQPSNIDVSGALAANALYAEAEAIYEEIPVLGKPLPKHDREGEEGYTFIAPLHPSKAPNLTDTQCNWMVSHNVNTVTILAELLMLRIMVTVVGLVHKTRYCY